MEQVSSLSIYGPLALHLGRELIGEKLGPQVKYGRWTWLVRITYELLTLIDELF